MLFAAPGGMLALFISVICSSDRVFPSRRAKLIGILIVSFSVLSCTLTSVCAENAVASPNSFKYDLSKLGVFGPNWAWAAGAAARKQEVRRRTIFRSLF